MKKILITGAAGQLGTDLALDLPRTQSGSLILLTDVRPLAPPSLANFDYQQLDVTQDADVEALVTSFKPDEIYHLAALLSGTGEKNPALAWNLNVNAFKHLLDVCVTKLPCVKIFLPSSIAVFGPGAGKLAAQHGYLDPASMYGITKLTGEQLANYYHRRYQLDVRSLRFPGLISSKAHPGGGTTDFSVEIFWAVAQGKPYVSFLKKDTALPLLYMPDALEAIHTLMAAESAKLTVRTSYNINGFSGSPEDFAHAIGAHLGQPIQISYAPDFRQGIADSWPAALEDNAARSDWGWKPTFGLPALVADMFEKIGQLQAQS